ncbi:MAG TPA: two-component regulator propeller domain-containing protein [Bacteroidales bacterium]|nr:two-component regulator propeller domain-containing protein [Bacteroidales bacterium]
MRRYTITAIILLCTWFRSPGQVPVGSWQDHLSYSSSYYLAAGDDNLYSSAGASLLVVDTQTNTLSKLSKANGLTETGISAIGWSEQEESLIIVYRNTDVDLVKRGIITNIPDIRNKYIPGLKEIYNISVSGNLAFLSGSFGIVVIDAKGRYVADTWRPGPDGNTNEVFETILFNERIYAATAKGIFSAPRTRTGLSYFGNWDKLDGLLMPDALYDKISATATALFYNKPGEASLPDSLFRIIPGQPAELVFSRQDTKIRSVDPAQPGISVALTSSIALFSDEGSLMKEITTYGWASPQPQNTLTFNDALWIADASVGLVSTTNFSTFINHTLPGPYTNNVTDIFFAGTKAYVTGGTVDNAWGNVYRPLQVFINSGREWISNILYGPNDRDALRVVADPADPDHYFVSSWGNGLYEFKDNTLINNFNQYNSPLSSIIPGDNYTRICGLAFDRMGNLWIAQSGVSGNLKVLKTDGTWVSTVVNLNVPVTGDLVIDDNNFIWTTLPRGHGILVYDPGVNTGDISDDRYLMLQVEDNEGHVMNSLFSAARDKDGNIWVGTDMGPAVYYTPGKVFDSDLKATRIKVPRNDGSGLADYLLGTETITSIAVDGANRKWFGTMSSGAYLVSEDGKSQIYNFSSGNSPILSDNIVKISINNESGEVWFGTSSGIITFRGDATAGKNDYSGMYVFPNPVREDFDGPVTVTGLIEGSRVKITDINGNLVFETTSNGGQAQWDLKNYRGNRVNTGVYLIFTSNGDGTMAKVIKLLIIS